MNAIMDTDLRLATRWREATRAAFTEAMAANYFVEDFSRVSREQDRVGVYVLMMNAEL